MASARLPLLDATAERNTPLIGERRVRAWYSAMWIPGTLPKAAAHTGGGEQQRGLVDGVTATGNGQCRVTTPCHTGPLELRQLDVKTLVAQRCSDIVQTGVISACRPRGVRVLVSAISCNLPRWVCMPSTLNLPASSRPRSAVGDGDDEQHASIVAATTAAAARSFAVVMNS